MGTKYTQQQLNKALESLPEELGAALFSVETSEKLADVSERYNIYGEKGVLLSKHVGYVLMGLVLPQEFEQLLQNEIKLPKKTAQEVAREINRFVFYPVKPALEQLHNTQITATSKTSTSKPTPQETEQPEFQEKPSGPDIYQEPLEEE